MDFPISSKDNELKSFALSFITESIEDICFAEKTEGGIKVGTAKCEWNFSTKTNKVYVSPSFEQSLWNLCYIYLATTDLKLSNDEWKRIMQENQINLSTGEIIKQAKIELQQKEGYPERQRDEEMLRYLEEIESIEDFTPKIFKITKKISQGIYDNDCESTLAIIRSNKYLNKRVDELFKCGITFIILHEYTHLTKNHYELVHNKLMFYNQAELEADDNAYALLTQNILPQGKMTAQIGIYCALLSLFFSEHAYESDERHPFPDQRLEPIYLKMDDKTRKKAVKFLEFSLNLWAKEYHIKNFPLDSDIDNILEFLKYYA